MHTILNTCNTLVNFAEMQPCRKVNHSKKVLAFSDKIKIQNLDANLLA